MKNSRRNNRKGFRRDGSHQLHGEPWKILLGAILEQAAQDTCSGWMPMVFARVFWRDSLVEFALDVLGIDPAAARAAMGVT